MHYRSLGRTGIQVSPYALGTMNFGTMFNADRDEAIRIIRRALDGGINFIDTADVYSAGESEEIVAKALQGRRDDVVLSGEILDGIDAVVAPGADIGQHQIVWNAPALTTPVLRRRPATARPAA